MCRTCQINEDFTDGDPDYCTSCHSTENKILNLAGDKPTCVMEPPEKTTMIIVQNNKILGVSSEYSYYGGTDSMNMRVDEADADPEDYRDTNQGENSHFGMGECSNNSTECMPPMDDQNGGMNQNPGEGQGQGPHGAPQANHTAPDDNMTFFEAIEMIEFVHYYGHQRSLPNVIEVINQYGIMGIGMEKDRDDICTASIGEPREQRNLHPGIMYIAIPCPEGCEQCMVTHFGFLKCVEPEADKFVQNGMVVDSCPVEGYLEKGTMCMSCSNALNGNGCTACQEATLDGEPILECTACDTTLGLNLMEMEIENKTIKRCVDPEGCDPDKYYNGTHCTTCADHCEFCNGQSCIGCADDFVMMIAPDGARTCIPDDPGCPDGYYLGSGGACRMCDSSCATCFDGGPHNCKTCSDSSQVLRPMQFLRLDRLNARSEYEFWTGGSDFSLEYQPPDDVPVHGTCAADCDVEGFALWNDTNICVPCMAFGCTECDNNGMCTHCSKRHRLSLIDDPEGPENPGDPVMKICAPCMLMEDGCRLCEDDNIMSCKMCNPMYSLMTQDDGSKTCVHRCPSGFFSKSEDIDPSMAPDTMRYLGHMVCTECGTDCEECRGDEDHCLLCKDPTKIARPDGTCGTDCPDGFFAGDGRCQKCRNNTATCEIDSVTNEYKALTCEDDFFRDQSMTKCIEQRKCGKGYFGNGSSGDCEPCDYSACSECMDAADKCTKCADTTKFESSDGSCVDTINDVNCLTSQFKNSAGKCTACDRS